MKTCPVHLGKYSAVAKYCSQCQRELVELECSNCHCKAITFYDYFCQLCGTKLNWKEK